MLVLDASVALHLCAAPKGLAILAREELTAPPLMWSECRSVLHETLGRQEISAADAIKTLEVLEQAPIVRREPPHLGSMAWSIADHFGWAKTYDAEYLALAQLLGCRLVTLDARLHRATARLGYVISLAEVK